MQYTRYVRQRVFVPAGAIALVAYGICSISMTMTNKHLLTYTDVHSPIALLLWQHCIAIACTLAWSWFVSASSPSPSLSASSSSASPSLFLSVTKVNGVIRREEGDGRDKREGDERLGHVSLTLGEDDNNGNDNNNSSDDDDDKTVDTNLPLPPIPYQLHIPITFDRRIALQWLPVNVCFVLMLLSGSLALRHLSVAIVTCFKNSTTIVIAIVEAMSERRRPTAAVAASATLMVAGSAVAGWEDLEFSAIGDLWMLVNVASSAAYVLYCRRIMSRLRLQSLQMVFYNNLLSLPLLAALVVLWTPAEAVGAARALASGGPLVVLLLIFNGLLAYFLSTCSLWAMRTTSGTTYSITGSVVKVPTTLVSVWLYATPFTANGELSLAASLLGGIVYAYARAKENARVHLRQAFVKRV